MAVYGIPPDPKLVIPIPQPFGQGEKDIILAREIKQLAAELSHAIAQAKQAGLSVDVLWRLEDDTAEITIVREY